MTTLRKAAQQALEALETRGEHHPRVYRAIEALRAALAQQAEPVEPVAHLWQQNETGRTRVVMPDQFITADDGWRVVGPLCLVPPQRKPLTEEEMYIVEEEARKNFRLTQAGPRGQIITYWDSLTPWLIRAVERAHGIEE